MKSTTKTQRHEGENLGGARGPGGPSVVLMETKEKLVAA